MIESVASLGQIGASLAASTTKGAPAVGAPSDGNMSFEKLLGNFISDGVATVREGESLAIQGMLGQAPPLKVVGAVMAAQQVLHSGLAIRDKVVSAYQELSHMTI